MVKKSNWSMSSKQYLSVRLLELRLPRLLSLYIVSFKSKKKTSNNKVLILNPFISPWSSLLLEARCANRRVPEQFLDFDWRQKCMGHMITYYSRSFSPVFFLADLEIINYFGTFFFSKLTHRGQTGSARSSWAFPRPASAGCSLPGWPGFKKKNS